MALTEYTNTRRSVTEYFYSCVLMNYQLCKPPKNKKSLRFL